MIYKWTTLKPVIGSITRNIKTMDGSYMDDLTEWVAEAIDQMRTRYQLELVCKDVTIDFHQGKMPCMLEAIACVVYKGRRLNISNNVIPSRSLGYRNVAPDTAIMQTVVTPATTSELVDNTTGTLEVDRVTLQSVLSLPEHTQEFYKINYNKIETSMKNACIQVYYWKTPTDEEGFPMIPDNPDYKQAIYFYCRMMMIGAGYEDKVFKYSDCEQRWELHAGRAISAITYPTIDETHRSMQTNVRLISTDYHWERADQGPSPELDYYN